MRHRHSAQWGDDPSRPSEAHPQAKVGASCTTPPGAGCPNSSLCQCPGDGGSLEDSTLDLAFPEPQTKPLPSGQSEAEGWSIQDTPPAIFLEIHGIRWGLYCIQWLNK